mmetsp:Transcript_59227/g.141422  ORF Transcript_59227/g.141422 Transcript_59227/m.141422 type:complete len:141 (-) Transcript_59227:106-528(-)|eukprot:CAMPEP_0178414070 /NCGR_PEP_ID=MMETSP0689_2-20121128/22848_1 /TAXON_ID=160604 /ORGANISM="Amphidinium massartii, Strain CS-259" /LENGTH=140 /DNA_ID=CAMNT_0020035351 /DNA_START=103 /DNA_END=525 /DNA_ORIENTATION=+
MPSMWAGFISRPLCLLALVQLPTAASSASQLRTIHEATATEPSGPLSVAQVGSAHGGSWIPTAVVVPSPVMQRPGKLTVQNDITMTVTGDYYAAPRVSQGDKAWLRGMLTEEKQQEDTWLREQMGLTASQARPAAVQAQP